MVPAYRGLRVRRWGLGFVHRSRTILCRPRAQPSRYDSQLLRRCTLCRKEGHLILAVTNGAQMVEAKDKEIGRILEDTAELRLAAHRARDAAKVRGGC